ncbi:MAG: Crp/Fnr family transcriptional regulator [Trueperaceae bacterium]|nr:Crp/Fnr family transcriptional regulator [Trueperaceae bacterium]
MDTLSHTRAETRTEPRYHVAPMKRVPARHYGAGEILFHAHERVTGLHLIDEGQVKLVVQTASGHERILAVLGAGDAAGAASLQAATYGADAVAITPVAASYIPRDEFFRRSKTEPELASAYAEGLARDLQHAWRQLAQAYTPVRARLAATLLDLAIRFGVGTGRRSLHTRLSHDDLAAMIGANRVSVSTAMADLRRVGAVVGARGRYFLDLSRLACATGEAGADADSRRSDFEDGVTVARYRDMMVG